MKRLVLLAALAIFSAFARAPTVTVTSVDSISHSVARVHFNVSESYKIAQTLITPTQYGSCASGRLPTGAGKAAWIQPGYDLVTSDARIVVGGLQPNTQYMVCPQASLDGANWGTGSITFTTLPLPGVHPAVPIAPQTFDTSYPRVTAAPVTVNSNCNDPKTGLQQLIYKALQNQKTADQVIEIPAGEVCIGRYNFSDTNLANQPDLRQFSPSSVSTNTALASGSTTYNAITFRTPHLFTEGQQVIFGNVYGLSAIPPTIFTANSLDPCSLAGTLMPGEDYYYVHDVDANTIQLYCSASQAHGGTLIQFSNQGRGAANHFLLAPWPRQGMHQIIIRTAAPDSQLPPEKTRIGPQWAPQMAVIEKPMQANGAADNSPFAGVVVNDIDSNTQIPISNIRFVGIEFTTQQSTDAQTSTDPTPWMILVRTFAWNQNIIFDRCWLHGQPNPDRTLQALSWEGKNAAWVDSYWDNLNFWHAEFTGLGASYTANSFTLQSGAYVYGTASRKGTLSTPATVTISGSGSGPFLTYFELSGSLQVVLPSGETGRCSGNSNCTVTTSNALTGTGSCDHDDRRFPFNNHGNIAVAPIACGQITNGSVTSFSNRPSGGFNSGYAAEGHSNISSTGPGPMMLVNNYIEGTGISMHFDDGGGLKWYRHDYTIKRNRFVTLFTHQFHSPVSDGMRYGHRQPIEWKEGSIISMQGNVFDGNFADDNNNGVFITMTESASGNSAHDGWGIQDVNIENNTFEHGPGIIAGPGFVQGGLNHQMTPSIRFRFKNNLAWDINGWLYNTYDWQNVHGTLFYSLDGAEDYIIDHNTIANNTGLQGDVFVQVNTFLEGLRVTNNIFQIGTTGYCPTPLPAGDLYGKCVTTNGGVLYQGDGGSLVNPYGCNDQGGGYRSMDIGHGQATADCIFPGYQWTNNLMIPGRATTKAQVERYWPNKSSWANHNYFASSGDVRKVGFVSLPAAVLDKYLNGDDGTDFHLVNGSPYANAGTDGTQIGANIDALNAAQGAVIGVSAAKITSSSAMITFNAPDSQSCPVDYSSTDPTLITKFTRVADSGTSPGARSVRLAGLAALTSYYYRIDCAVQQPTGSFLTLSRGGGTGTGAVTHTGNSISLGP